jgi:hypothetical protein
MNEKRPLHDGDDDDNDSDDDDDDDGDGDADDDDDDDDGGCRYGFGDIESHNDNGSNHHHDDAAFKIIEYDSKSTALQLPSHLNLRCDQHLQ